MRHGAVLFDADNRVIAANPLAARLTGLPPEVFRPGATIADLRAAQIAAGEYSEAEAVAGGRTDALHAPQRFVRTRPDGTVVEVTTDRTPEGLFVRTYSDVTEDRRIRADLEAARAASEAAARAKSRFLATMTHELRTPLNAVIGFADLLKRPQPAEEVAEYAGMIADAGRELLGLIDQILDVARSETAGLPVRAGRVDLARLLSQVVQAKGSAAATGRIALSLDLPPALPEITADGARFEQVVQGLLSNALKFTDAGGSVRVSACLGADGAVSVRVADTGIGISAEALPRVFEPFAQLDAGRARRYAGSGIGLYLARSIAEAMGMRLTLSSKEGEGTVATLLIPPELACPPEEESA
jgi:signal transduction histidine kinase